jgi:hypothetical protein
MSGWELTLFMVQVKAVAVQPAEYKIQDGLLPFQLEYPTIIGRQLYFLLNVTVEHMLKPKDSQCHFQE